MKTETKKFIAKIVLFYALLHIILANISYLYTSVYTLTSRFRIMDLRYNEYMIGLAIMLIIVLSLLTAIVSIISYAKLLFANIFYFNDEETEENQRLEKRMLYKRTMNIILLVAMSFVFTLLVAILGTFIGY